MEEIQDLIHKAIEDSTDIDKLIEKANKPIYEFVATYDAGIFTRYIGCNKKN